jgi:hypothetical protein
MAKNLSTFQPGAATATTDLKYKTIVYTGTFGPDMNSCNTGNDYGHQHYYMDRKRHTFCGGAMKKGTLENQGTDIYHFGGGGSSGGACCCQQSSSGQSGGVAKYTPQWAGDSDHLMICVMTGNGCCRAACNGECSYMTSTCHTSGGHAGTPINRVCTSAGCGAAAVCNWFYGGCCNYGAIASSGGQPLPSSRGCSMGCVYTCCLEEPTADVDVGFDCVYCKAPAAIGFESGSCINKSDSGICGKPMWTSFGGWKNSAYRNGTVMLRGFDVCEQNMGGWNYRNTYCCDFGTRSEISSYMTVGFSMPSAAVQGGNCCCGGPGTANMQIIRFHEDEV